MMKILNKNLCSILFLMITSHVHCMLNSSSSFFEGAQFGKIRSMRRIVESIPAGQERRDFINRKDWHFHEGITALHEAASHNHVAITSYLIREGADIDSKSYTDDTPLHVAAANGSAEVARILLDAGANYSLLNVENKNPLRLAIEGKKNGVIRLFDSYTKRKFAACLAMATHPRLGSESPMSLLPQHLLGDIAALSSRAEILQETQEKESDERRRYNYMPWIGELRSILNDIRRTRTGKVAVAMIAGVAVAGIGSIVGLLRGNNTLFNTSIVAGALIRVVALNYLASH